MKQILIHVSLILILASCAKVREENKPGTEDELRYEKSTLTGLDPVKSTDVRNFSDFENRFDPIDPKKGKVWLHKYTITNVSSIGGPVFIGLQGDLSAGYFKFSKDSLEFLSAVNPNRKDDGKIDDVILKWGVEHSEYRYREVNGRPTNTVEENEFLKWNQKQNFIIDWAKSGTLVPTLENKWGPCWNHSEPELINESVKLSEGYLEFTKKITTTLDSSRCGSFSLRHAYRTNVFQYEVTHSFKVYEVEADPTKRYEPYVYNGEFDPLIQKYGYFKTPFEEEKDNGQPKVNFLMNRWNPKIKMHTFYFAPGFPEKYKWIYKTDPKKKDPYGKPVIGVFDKTNEVLAQSGSPMRFEVREAPEGVHFGDLRYSFVKFMEESNPRSPLGYGPSDANPFTGEIVSANSMVWTGSLGRYIDLIAEWLKRSDKDNGSSQSIYAEMAKIMETPDVNEWRSTARDLDPGTDVGNTFKKMLPDFTYGVTFWAPFTVGHDVDPTGKVILPADETDVFEFKDIGRLQNKFGNVIDEKMLKMLRSLDHHGKKHVDHIKQVRSNNDTTIYRADAAMDDVQGMLLDGKTPQEVLDTILYRVAIHEFGHNISLRHNFYGSVDKNNFGPGETHKHTVKGKVQERHLPAVSSSVMDYLSLDGEMHTAFEWEAYDKAAIAYAYTTGKVDHSNDVYPKGHPRAGEKKSFLFCTDEHRAFNALCNTWDLGTTPSEIVMSQIDAYQKSYFTTNRRFDRAYWDTRGYDSRIFGTMWNLKKFMMLDQAAFDYGNKEYGEVYQKMGISKTNESKFHGPIKRDIRRAIKLSVAFYNAVLQQSNVERQYFSEYDEQTGALLRKGIFADKFYATYFLLGDDSFMYNPNIPVSFASYLEYQDDPDVGNAIKKVSENLLTERVDSEPGFINFARLMYADAATNFYNQNNVSLADRIKLTCYSAESFTKYFGFNPYSYTYKDETEPTHLVADVVNLTTQLPENNKIQFTEFGNETSEVGIALDSRNVYVASRAKNEVAFSVIKKYKEAYNFGDGEASDRLGQRLNDLRYMRMLYLAMTGVEDRCR